MHLKSLLKDIRFWILLFFLIRLVGITNPPLETGHNWRQTTVTMVARNYLEIDNNIFYPRVDFAGEKTGITGMEFPVLNYMIYATAEVFGYQHWYGRLINLLISSIGIWFFYLLVRKYFSDKTAFYASILLLVSIWFQFSRKIMPDTFSMSLILAGIYYGTNYLEGKVREKGLWNVLAYFLLITIGVLSKLPSGFILVVFAYFIFDGKIPMKRKVIFSAASLVALLPVVAWYYHWVPKLVEDYGFWHFFMGKSFLQGIVEIGQNLNLTLSRFYDTALKFSGFALFLFGLYTSIKRRDWKVYGILAIATLSFAVIIFKAGYTFSHHTYYIVPFAPVMALVAGYGLSQIKSMKWVVALLVIVGVEGIANQQNDFRIKEKNLQILNLEEDLNKVSDAEEMILINSGNYPTPMYFAHRKGWINSNSEIQREGFLDSLQTLGLDYVVILKRSFGSEISLEGRKVVLENGDYCIYEL